MLNTYNAFKKKVKDTVSEIKSFVPQNAQELEEFRIKHLGPKGTLKQTFLEMKELGDEVKKDAGKIMQDMKESIESHYIRMGTSLISAGNKAMGIGTKWVEISGGVVPTNRVSPIAVLYTFTPAPGSRKKKARTIETFWPGQPVPRTGKNVHYKATHYHNLEIVPE